MKFDFVYRKFVHCYLSIKRDNKQELILFCRVHNRRLEMTLVIVWYEKEEEEEEENEQKEPIAITWLQNTKTNRHEIKNEITVLVIDRETQPYVHNTALLYSKKEIWMRYKALVYKKEEKKWKVNEVILKKKKKKNDKNNLNLPLPGLVWFVFSML